MNDKTQEINGDRIAAAVNTEARHELESAVKKIKHCVDQLSDEQVWWRSSESQNSIGNLILHLCGNVTQWIVAGIGGAQDVRERSLEFSERGPTPKADLLARLEEVQAEAAKIVSTMSASELLRIRRIQGFEVTGLAAVFHTLPHFRGHTQEIVHMTRHLLGESYRFAWKPQTVEQGASAKGA